MTRQIRTHYIALTLAVILLASTPITYAKPQKQTFTANVVGEVQDLGEQIYKINGKGGVVQSLLTITDITEAKIKFDLDAKVVDTDTHGKAELNVKGKSPSGEVELEAEIYINAGLTIPELTLPNGDNIPLVFIGGGKAEVEIGEEESIYDIAVMIDTTTAQHPFKGDLGHTGMISVIEVNGLFAVDVEVTKFDVKYRNIVLAGVVSGDMTGTVSMVVDSDEDHVADVEKDRGKMTFSVVYEGQLRRSRESVTVKGSFEGKSIQMPELSYLYYSTGKFETHGGLRSTGIYETIWVAPLAFTSTFQGTVNG